MDSLRYEILGPLRLHHAQGQPLRASKPRQLLATLLLHPNRFVSTDLIADALWEGSPPRSATANIRTYVRALRGVLQEAGLPTPIDTSASGYSIEVGVDELDASLFESLLAEAGHLRAVGDGRQAMALFTRAYNLWRGQPLADLNIASAWEGSIARLDAQYRSLVDTLLDLRLEYGDATGAAVLLSGRLTEDPYDEQLWARLIDALVDAGRSGEARTAYQKATRTLAEDLGVEPGPELQAAGARAERGPGRARPAVLQAVPPPEEPQPGPMAERVGPRQVPSQLPLDLADFSGRNDELIRLRDLICGRDPVRPPIAVISGPPGTGKTALAVRLGHLVREFFPDGQIYLDMRGATQPRDPASALHDLLRSLDIPDSAVPADPDRRSAALRSELASRRVLIVLDDVGAASQVVPLMPGTGASALVVTSRSRLTDLAGADVIALDTLDHEEASELLRRVAGKDRIDSDSRAADEILTACGNLPLAIRIAASRLAQRPDLTPAELARRLQDETQRLDELSIGELAVRTSADLSYDSLRAEDARLYRLIGHLAVGDFSGRSLEALAAPAATRRSLDRLIEANLVQVSSVDQGGRPRYRVHDLLRLHATEIGDPGERAMAVADLTTVLEAFLDRCRWATQALPFEYFGVLESQPLKPDPLAMSASEAVTWFDEERNSFIPAIRAAAHNGLHEHAWRIAAAWAPYLDMRAGFDDWLESHRIGLASARACGDLRGQAIMLRCIGQCALYRDDWPVAERSLTDALALFDQVGDQIGYGVASVGFGTFLRERATLDQAFDRYETAMTAFIEAGDANGEAVARSAIASVCLRRDDTGTAGRHLAQAFLLGVRLGDPHREAKVRRRIAELREQQGRHDQAVRQLRAALQIFLGIGDDHCAAYTRTELGKALVSLGEDAAARKALLDAIEAGHRLGDRSVEAQAAFQLGQSHQQAGHLDSARRYLSRAARVWQLVGADEQAAEARRQLADLTPGLAAG
ncbi:AfsR/SARP family transcriptional regulator [Kribbella deserti]|uniref:BTAD domain-containing putative transcriptional regulator n=1 Tax=Kribbella deserti TaxID=1926257 RepID=A0ABV6QRD8_9ACTN